MDNKDEVLDDRGESHEHDGKLKGKLRALDHKLEDAIDAAEEKIDRNQP